MLIKEVKNLSSFTGLKIPINNLHQKLANYSPWPNLACCLFLYNACIKNSFLIFTWLKKKSKEYFMTCENMKLKCLSTNTFIYLFTVHTTVAEFSSCDRDYLA